MKNKYLLLSIAFIAVAVSTRLTQVDNRTNKRLHKDARELKENRSVALDALEFTTEAAAYPNKDIPANAYVSAINWYKNNNAATQRTTSTTNWLSIGPTNMGGRTIGIAIDPTDTATIWLGAAGGGLWKTTTGGIGTNPWTYVPLGFSVLGVSSIAINPKNHNEMYVGTGEVYSDSSYSQGIVAFRPTRGSYGMGLFKSTNGGVTWTQSINWTYQQNKGIWDIVINPLKPTTVYAGTTDGVYKSFDAGATWTRILNVAMAMNLQMHSIDTNILLCGCGNYGSTIHGIYRTTNSGATWNVVTSGLPSANSTNGRITFAVNPNNNDSMFAHICDVYNTVGLYRSVDKGATWTLLMNQDIASYQGWYCKGLAVQPGNPNNMLIGGVDLFSSTDGGATFSDITSSSPVFHSDVHNVIVNPQDPNKIYVITDGGIFRSNDFGNSFYDCNIGYITTQAYIGSISSTDTTVLLTGLQDNYVIKYTNNQTWTPVIGGDGCYNAIDHTNDFIQYGADQYLNAYECNDQGAFFSGFQMLNNSANATTPNYAAFLAPYILCYSNTQYIYAGGLGLQLSTNGGGSFTFKGNNPVFDSDYIMTIASSYTNTDSVYFACAPYGTDPMKVYFSANEGTTVKDISAGLPNRYPRRMAVNPSNSKEVYIVYSGFGGKHIFKSTNSGGTWTDISTTLPDLPFQCITVDPKYPNYLYAGCDFGVFYSPDNGTTWYAYDNGFPDVSPVYDLIVSPSDRCLYAFTHGHGMFKRDLSDIKPTGINELAHTGSTIKVFPNPAVDQLTVNTGAGGNLTDKYIARLYDMTGKEISTIEFEGVTYRMNVSNLTTGTYILNVSKNGISFATQKFIKE
jgi:hypothetical protein